MAWYLKQSVGFISENKEMFECISFIGQCYGRKSKNKGNNFYEGKRYISKKIPGASMTSLDHMVFPTKKTGYQKTYQWKFKKRAYQSTYALIVELLLRESPYQSRALDLLKDLNNKTLLSDKINEIPKSALETLLGNSNEIDLIIVKNILRQFKSDDNWYNKVR